MVNTCYVPNCSSSGKDKVSFFRAPKDQTRFAAWEKAINRLNLPLSRSSYVCERHFKECDIIRCNSFVINGEVVSLARGNPRLKPGVVPSLFPGKPFFI
jgi:THAP domain